jgi:hypothetical protein
MRSERARRELEERPGFLAKLPEVERAVIEAAPMIARDLLRDGRTALRLEFLHIASLSR